MITKEVAKMLGVSENSLRKYKGVFRWHKSYFYLYEKYGYNEMMNYILSKIPDAEIVDYGDHWHSFVGGAKGGSEKDSFFWVKFKV